MSSDKCFSRAGNKKQHEMTHAGDKPHTCQYCDKGFCQIGVKKQHEMTHTRDKPQMSILRHASARNDES